MHFTYFNHTFAETSLMPGEPQGCVVMWWENELGRKFHEMQVFLLLDGAKPNIFERVGSFRGAQGTVNMIVLINGTCQWCHKKINRTSLTSKFGTAERVPSVALQGTCCKLFRLSAFISAIGGWTALSSQRCTLKLSEYGQHRLWCHSRAWLLR